MEFPLHSLQSCSKNAVVCSSTEAFPGQPSVLGSPGSHRGVLTAATAVVELGLTGERLPAGPAEGRERLCGALAPDPACREVPGQSSETETARPG